MVNVIEQWVEQILHHPKLEPITDEEWEEIKASEKAINECSITLDSEEADRLRSTLHQRRGRIQTLMDRIERILCNE